MYPTFALCENLLIYRTIRQLQLNLVWNSKYEIPILNGIECMYMCVQDKLMTK